MKKRGNPYVVSVAWYEEADYLSLAGEHPEPDIPHPSYGAWRREKMDGLFAILESGRALDLVTVRAEPYHLWLGEKKDTSLSRGRYLAHLSTGPS